MYPFDVFVYINVIFSVVWVLVIQVKWCWFHLKIEKSTENAMKKHAHTHNWSDEKTNAAIIYGTDFVEVRCETLVLIINIIIVISIAIPARLFSFYFIRQLNFELLHLISCLYHSHTPSTSSFRHAPTPTIYTHIQRKKKKKN